jgi:4-hydroxy-tetrahydrodipicolinate synthase
MIAGSMVALVTPMDAQGRLDWDALSKLVDFHLQEGTNAIVAVGTTGESATLDVNEHIEVIRRVVDQVAGRIPVIAGTGANSTREAVELTTNAKTAGADPGRLVPAFPPHRRSRGHPADSLQRSWPHRMRHAAGNR